ncbi:MAG: FAD-dependent oxidoreductase [Bacilli bacterium]|nr:FAD-dependent oxidoreductase [Bacilli bacterium]
MLHVNDWDFPHEDYHCDDPEKKRLVIKLAKMITDSLLRKLPGKMHENHMDFWILDRLLTKEEVKFMLSFKKRRVFYRVEELAKMNKMSIEDTQKMLDHICGIGLIEFNRHNEERVRQYMVPKWVVGSGEYMVEHKTLCDEHPEVATMFNLAPQEPLALTSPMIPPGGAGIGMHVIPVEQAIPADSKPTSVELLTKWIDKYDKFCSMVCACRKAQRFRGEGVGDIEGHMCIGVGDMAEYLVESGKDAKYITKEEVVEILKRSEEKGYVHQITNLDGPEHIVGICNCSAGSCYGLRTSQLFNTPNMSRSAYRAHVTTANCVACGKCVEVCPAGAARLGQKLCLKNGKPQEYPTQILPDDHKWGEEMWDRNYRETNKLNCYDTGTSPCKTACPAHLAVQGYIKMAAEGRYEDALKLIRQDNPFPAVCGSVCNKRCETRCTRGLIDKPVSIDEIKKFLAYRELDKKNRYIPNCYNGEGKQWDDYKIAIIGAGPAGLTAAYYLRIEGYPVTVFEKEKVPGGMLVNGIPNFRLDKKVVQAEIDIIKEMGAEIRCGVEVGKDITLDELRKQGYKAFYIAIGLQGGRLAGVPGEDAKGVESGVSFLKRINQDQSIKLNGEVVVIGGGNVAADVARTAIRANGGAKVTMLCLESRDEMPAAKDEIDEVEAEGISILNGWGPKEIIKDEKGNVKSVIFKKCTQLKDAEGKFNPQYDENETITVECQNVLMAIGQSAEWGDLLKGSKVELRRNGTAVADQVTCQTAEPDIFVGGDIFHGAKFAIDAIADGKEGMVSINRFVHPGQSLTIGRDLRHFIEFDRDDILVEGYDNAPRQAPGMKEGEPIKTFEDLRLPLTEEQVKKEASRCLSCGACRVDLNKCIGCGLCTTRCKFDAIHLSRDIPEAAEMHHAEDMLKVVFPYIIKRKKAIKARKKADKKAAKEAKKAQA